MSNTAPQVSFLVLSYNYGRFIGDTIRSILAQEAPYSFEVVVVDDASTDNSLEVITSFEDERLRCFQHERNLGHAATVTDGLRATRGTYVARIDSDDRYRPNFLAETVPLLEKNPEVGLVYGDAAIIDDAGVRTALTTDTQHGNRDFCGYEFVALLEKNFICAPTVIARREAWLQALPIPAGLSFHDWWFTLQIARRWQLCYRNEVLADYRVHGANLHTVIARNKSEEVSIMRVLDQIFAEQEQIPELQAQKMAARDRVYGAHYLVLAFKYFGARMSTDARRCYLEAVRRRPTYLSNAAVVRQLFATFMGQPLYERVKGAFKRA